MTFIEKGYLAAYLDTWPANVRKSFPTYSRLTGEMSELIQWTIAEMGSALSRHDTRNVMSIASPMRLAEFVQAAITLLERGMVTAARTCLRSGVETVFFLGGFADIPNFYQMALNEHVFQSTRMLKSRIRHAERYVVDPAERDGIIAMLRKQIAEKLELADLPEGKKLKGWNLRDDVAAKCDLLEVYDEHYRALSLDAAHAGLSSVEDLFEGGPHSLQFGPGAGDYFETFYFLMVIGDAGLTQCNVLLKSDHLRQRLKALSDETAAYEKARMGITDEPPSES